MTNSYYNGGNVPAPNAPGASSAIRNEFSLVASGFDKLPALSAGAANNLIVVDPTGTFLVPVASVSNFTFVSPILTGTPTAPTAAAGTSTTQIATTAFVAATAFSSALPAQTGNAGKFATTNGVTASWVDLPPVAGNHIFLANNFGGF